MDSSSPLDDPGAFLRKARIRAGMSQKAAAAILGVHPSMVSAYERNMRNPTIATLQRFLDAVGVTLTGQLEKSGSLVERAVNEALRRTPDERAREFDWMLEAIAAICDGVPYIVTGLAAALVQGAPVKVPRVEWHLADDEEVLTTVATRMPGKLPMAVWDPGPRWYKPLYLPVSIVPALRTFDPSIWRDLITHQEVQVTLRPAAEVEAAYGASTLVPIGAHELRVVSLWEVELADPAAAAILRRTREVIALREPGRAGDATSRSGVGAT